MSIADLSELIRKGSSKKASASLIAAEPELLVLAVTETAGTGRVFTRTLRLSGKWRVTPANEIEFAFTKPELRKRSISFGANWRVNDDNELELSLGRDRVALKGNWDIAGLNRLSYQIGRGTGQVMEFRASFGTKSLVAKKGELRYELGVGADRTRRTKRLTLFGKWRLSRALGLSFEIEYANGRKRAIRFGGEIHPSGDKTISVDLVARDRKPLGVEVLFTQSFRW